MKRALLELAKAQGLSLGETGCRLLQESLSLPPTKPKKEAGQNLLGLGLTPVLPPEILREEIADAFTHS